MLLAILRREVSESFVNPTYSPSVQVTAKQGMGGTLFVSWGDHERFKSCIALVWPSLSESLSELLTYIPRAIVSTGCWR